MVDGSQDNQVVGAVAERLRPMFRALRARNFRLFVGGQGISLIGTWMTRVATSWLVYRLTDSALLLGVVGFASQIPTFFLAPLAGVWVDRCDRHRLIIVTQIAAMIQSLALAVLTLTHAITIWQVIVLSLLQGLINSFDMPARQAFLVQMVGNKEDLSNAIALNSSMFNGARLIGPSIAGLTIALTGEGICFLIDGLSYIAVIAALLAMRVPPQPLRAHSRPVWHELRAGFRYVTRMSAIANILLLLAVMSLIGLPYIVLMPVISADLLGGGANTFGMLMAATGLGALVGALWLAARRSVLGLGRLIPLACGTFGVGLILLALSRTLWISIGLLVFLGFFMMCHIASSNTLVQTIVDDDKRGRVMSMYTMALMGTTPFGSLIAGALAHWIGTPETLIGGGLCCVIAAILFTRHLPAMRKQMRPIYVRLGILPEIASGLQAAAAGQAVREEGSDES